VPRARRAAQGLVIDDEVDQHREQRHVAVVVELADGDPEAVDPVVVHHGVVFETAELTDTHAGAGQQFDHEAAGAGWGRVPGRP